MAAYLLKKEVEKIRPQVYLDSKSTLFKVINNFRLYDRVCIVSDLKSKFNNTAYLLAVKFFVAFLQPTHTIMSYSLLIYGPLVSLTKFLGSCA